MSETLTSEQGLESTTVKIYRTAAVVKGGRRFSFGALVVVGDRQGGVGIGYGKAPGVPSAIEKAQKAARKNMRRIILKESTIPHSVRSKFGASMVTMLPAAPGTGVIAGATVRAVLELAGIRDCLTKAYGSTNQKNLLKAALEGLSRLRSKEQIQQLRGQTLEPTEVERRLEEGRRFAPATPAFVPAPRPRGDGKRGKGGSDGGRGRGPKGKRERQNDESAGTATIAAEAPAQPESAQESQP